MADNNLEPKRPSIGSAYTRFSWSRKPQSQSSGSSSNSNNSSSAAVDVVSSPTSTTGTTTPVNANDRRPRSSGGSSSPFPFPISPPSLFRSSSTNSKDINARALIQKLDKQARQSSSNSPSNPSSNSSPPASFPSNPTGKTGINMERAHSLPQSNSNQSRLSSGLGGFGSSVMNFTSSLSLTRSRTGENSTTANNGSGNTTEEKDRGRSKARDKLSSKFKRPSSHVAPSTSASSSQSNTTETQKRHRSSSPFLARFTSRSGLGTRSESPSVEALKMSQSDAESDTDLSVPKPRRSNFSRRATPANSVEGDDDDSDDSGSGVYSDEEDGEGSEEEMDIFDPETEQNTEANSQIPDPIPSSLTPSFDIDIPDPLGEGVNVVQPPEPLFPSRQTKKGVGASGLELVTSRPVFEKDRCTVKMTHGDPEKFRKEGKKGNRYVIASDLSEESKYAVEWGIGTVLRDGDEMIIITIQETDSKLDPTDPASADRVAKLRNQQERQALAYLLVRQVTGLLQRTRLNVTVVCQAIHGKSSRRLLVDLMYVFDPVMLIVGSRGLGKLKGILLGSTSHYLIQKSPVPVMVARRRLRRTSARRGSQNPPRSRTPVPLAQATIEKVGPGKAEKDVEAMREEIEREEREEVAGGEPGVRRKGSL